MKRTLDAALLVRSARHRAGLSQRALAKRAGTAQSVIARIEAGTTDPTTGTLRRLVAAADAEITCDLGPATVADSHMLDDVGRILSLTPEERLLEVRNLARFESAARRA